MAIDVTLLLTRADCDAVTETFDQRLRLLDNREANFGYQSEVGTARATDLTDELRGLNSRVPFLTTYLATLTAGTTEHTTTTDELRKKTDRRDELLSRQAKVGGVPAVLRQSELKEAQRRSASIEEDKALVVARRATLSA
ncbi:hypothetical protein [Hymenobacter sp. IS2118]|uniref:hypothetical protein n=1 Tax=Hymenobacter sp. IS2118 TaxID=1505605 RepID=UPI000554E113|nr:hypothetical protein [Hymenobacter sp. IS2118]